MWFQIDMLSIHNNKKCELIKIMIYYNHIFYYGF
jgi:hypothetical protein